MKSIITGNRDVDRAILLKADDRSIIYTCSVNKYARENLCDDGFFHNVLLKNHPRSLETKPVNMSYKNYYLNLVVRKEYLKEAGFIYTDGDINKYLFFLKTQNVNLAAREGLTDLVEFMLNLYKNREYDMYNWIGWDELLIQAVKGNKMSLQDIQRLILSQPNYDYGYNTALEFSVINDNQQFVDFFLQRGADPNFGLYGAAETGNIKEIKRFMDLGANNFNMAARRAALNTNEEQANELIDYFQELGRERNGKGLEPEDWDSIKQNASLAGNINIVKRATENGVRNGYNIIMNAILSRSLKKYDLIKYLIENEEGLEYYDSVEFQLKHVNLPDRDKILDIFRSYMNNE